MSRSLGFQKRRKKNQDDNSPQAEGARAFAAGVPRDRNPYGGPGYGKAHAWDRGWKRARQAAQ